MGWWYDEVLCDVSRVRDSGVHCAAIRTVHDSGAYMTAEIVTSLVYGALTGVVVALLVLFIVGAFRWP